LVENAHTCRCELLRSTWSFVDLTECNNDENSDDDHDDDGGGGGGGDDNNKSKIY